MTNQLQLIDFKPRTRYKIQIDHLFIIRVLMFMQSELVNTVDFYQNLFLVAPSSTPNIKLQTK